MNYLSNLEGSTEHPLLMPQPSWQYLVWKMEYNADRAEQETEVQNLNIVKGLQELAGSDMEWLGNILPDALIEVRQ